MEPEFQFFDDQEYEFVDSTEPTEERILKVRLDKWLWAARFFKTRALARAAVEAGKVFYNGERSKPSREIELGAELQVRQGRFEKIVIIKGLSTRRRSTEEALQLFEETELSKNNRADITIYCQAPSSQSYQNTHGTIQRDYSGAQKATRFLRRSFIRQPHSTEQRNSHDTQRPREFIPDYDNLETSE